MPDSIEMRVAKTWEVIGNAVAELARLHQEKLAQITGTATPATTDTSNNSDSSAVLTPTDSEQSGSTTAPRPSQPFDGDTSVPALDASTSAGVPQNIAREPQADITSPITLETPRESNNVLQLCEHTTIHPYNALELNSAAHTTPENVIYLAVKAIAEDSSTTQPSSPTPVLPRFRLPPMKDIDEDGDSTSTYIDKAHYDTPNRPFAKKHPAIFHDHSIEEYSLKAKPIPPHPNAPERAEASLPFRRQEKRVNLDSRRLGTASDHTEYFTKYIAGDQDANIHTALVSSGENNENVSPEVIDLNSIIEQLRASFYREQNLRLDSCSSSINIQQGGDQTEAHALRGKGEENPKPNLETDGSPLENRGRRNGGDSRIKVHIQTPSPKKPLKPTTAKGLLSTPTTMSRQPWPFNSNGRGHKSGLQRQDRNSFEVYRSKTSPLNSSARGRGYGRQKRGQSSSGGNWTTTQYTAETQTQTSSRIGSKSGSPAKVSQNRHKGLPSSPNYRVTPVIPRNYARALQITGLRVKNDVGKFGPRAQNMTGTGSSTRHSQALSLLSNINMVDIAKISDGPKAQTKKSHPSIARATITLGAPRTGWEKPAVEIATGHIQNPNLNLKAIPSKLEGIKTEHKTERISKSPQSPITKAISKSGPNILTTETVTEIAPAQERDDVPSIDTARKAQQQRMSVVKDSSKTKTAVSTSEKNKMDPSGPLETKCSDSEGGQSTQAQTPDPPNDTDEKMLSKSARKKRNKKQREAAEKQRKQEENEVLEAAAALNLEKGSAAAANGGEGDSTEYDEGERFLNSSLNTRLDSNVRIMIQIQGECFQSLIPCQELINT